METPNKYAAFETSMASTPSPFTRRQSRPILCSNSVSAFSMRRDSEAGNPPILQASYEMLNTASTTALSPHSRARQRNAITRTFPSNKRTVSLQTKLRDHEQRRYNSRMQEIEKNTLIAGGPFGNPDLRGVRRSIDQLVWGS